MSSITFVQFPSGHTDVRPMIPRTDTNLWSKAEHLRDRLLEQLTSRCHLEGIEPLLLASPPAVFPVWVKFEAWQPQGGDRSTTTRSSATVTIEPQPYHRHEFEFHVRYETGKTTRTARHLLPFNEGEVDGLVTYLVHGRRSPKFRRFRALPYQLWRPRNKIDGLRQDYLVLGMAGAAVGGFMLIALWPAALVLWSVALLLFMLARRRKWIVRSEGKPETEPRTLIRVDSWQTVLFGLADEQPEVRGRFVHAIEEGLAENCRFQPEHVWYWGLDGKEEREQLVLRGGRGIVFCQLYRYGGDLYVGWDGHLNAGQWVEQTVVSGIDKVTGNPVSMSRVVPGTQPLTEYDLTDLSCLMEWTHAQIVKLLKQIMDEKKIDQEIDFQIQRAERKDVVTSGAAPGKRENAPSLRTAFRRIG